MSDIELAADYAETENNISEFSEFESSLSEYRSRYEGVVYDLSVPEQEKQAKTDKLAIGKVISKLDTAHKTLKAPLKERVDLIDGERKRIKDQLLGIQLGIKDQIKEHEESLAKEKDELLRKASVFRDLREFEFPPTVEQVEERIYIINTTEIDDSYGEMKAFAALNKVESLQVLEPMLAGLKAIAEQEAAAEKARVEAETKARKEREAQIAKDAAENAKAEAQREASEAREKAATEAAAALAGAELQRRQALEREDKAKAKAEEDARAAVRAQREAVELAEREAQERAEQVERERLAGIAATEAAQAKREANKRHLSKINNAASAALQEQAGLTKDQAKAVVIAIAKKSIPSIVINY